MPCGNQPLVKSWDKPRHIRVIKSSRYEQNEASVKIHWKNVIKTLESSYKDEQFWESQSETVKELVGPVIFRRIAKIFNIPPERIHYEPQTEIDSLEPSELYYISKSFTAPMSKRVFSMSGFESSSDDEVQEEESEPWSLSSSEKKSTLFKSKSQVMSKSFSKVLSKSASKKASKSTKSVSSKSKGFLTETDSLDEPPSTLDDLLVHADSNGVKRKVNQNRTHNAHTNPHFEMLYCNKSETDMIKWKSKYKQKTYEVSASDEFSKKAEIMTKKIAKEFYEWWIGLGNVEFKSEIKRPEDIEDLFQVWFDEHASRGLVLEPKIFPCVLESIANYTSVKKASCTKVLRRQIKHDIHAETSPEHKMAFGTCLPQKMKHIPPKNNTEKFWHCVEIPEDLKSMACVWDNIQHLTSTKAFHQYLQKHPHLPMPPYLKALHEGDDKKQPFVIPSDYILKDRASMTSAQELALPVSQFSLELKEVLSKLLND